jgi:hypothetical protein
MKKLLKIIKILKLNTLKIIFVISLEVKICSHSVYKFIVQL